MQRFDDVDTGLSMVEKNLKIPYARTIMTRINKYLAEQGLASRREVDAWIKDKRLTINGAPAKLGMDASDDDEICLDGERLKKNPRKRTVTIALNKPVGYITTTDRSKPDTVLDLISLSDRLFPIGRLDVESSGLLLLTTDGDLAHRLMHPSFEHEKEYRVAVDYKLDHEEIDRLRKGVIIDGKKTKSAFVRVLGSKSFLIRITEGRNRQIRKMCEAIGKKVVKLQRVRIGEIRLGDLKPGGWRYLTEEEANWIRSIR